MKRGMFIHRLEHASSLQQYCHQPFRILSACFVIRHDFDVLRPGYSKAEFDGTADLFLLKDLFVHDGLIAAEVFQERDPDRVDGNPVRTAAMPCRTVYP